MEPVTISKIVKISDRESYSRKINLGAALPNAALPPLSLQHTWYEMKKHREWTSLAILPVTETVETLRIAHGLGLMALRDHPDTVWVINASSVEGDLVKASDIAVPGETDFPYKFLDLSDFGINQEKQLFTVARILEKVADQGHMNSRLIITVDSIIHNTHPIALCRSVDAVILCITLGKTTLNSVRRVVEIIGKEQIIGSIVLHPATS